MAPTFADLGVPDPIVSVLHQARIRSPFPVQAATIPDLFAGRDVIGRAPTGSGKTLAFGIPIIAGLERAEPRRPRALVLAPTRELADQIAGDLEPIAAAVERRTLAVYGGVGIERQINRLNRGVDLLVATPGRLEDLIERRSVTLEQASVVVVDEADRMADMGFMPAVRRILDQTPKRRQTILYSATLDGDVAKLIELYQHNPVRHEIGLAAPDLKTMQHHFWELPRPERIPLCASIIATFGRTIVFTRTRHGADRAARQLARLGVRAAAIHGNRSQAQRSRALDDFSNGRADALVATDVAARGIHVDGVACVVHFDPVDEDSAYIHRSGRTARAGAHGHVISFVDPSQVKLVKAMKRRLGLSQDITAPPETDGELPEAPVDDLKDRAPRRAASPRPSREGERRPSGDQSRGDRTPKPKGKRNPRGERNPNRKPKGERNPNRKPKPKGKREPNANRKPSLSGGPKTKSSTRRSGGPRPKGAEQRRSGPSGKRRAKGAKSRRR